MKTATSTTSYIYFLVSVLLVCIKAKSRENVSSFHLRCCRCFAPRLLSHQMSRLPQAHLACSGASTKWPAEFSAVRWPFKIKVQTPARLAVDRFSDLQIMQTVFHFILCPTGCLVNRLTAVKSSAEPVADISTLVSAVSVSARCMADILPDTSVQETKKDTRLQSPGPTLWG